MIWTVAIILLVFGSWAWSASHTMGGLIHLLLVLGLVAVLIQGVPRKRSDRPLMRVGFRPMEMGPSPG